MKKLFALAALILALIVALAFTGCPAEEEDPNNLKTTLNINNLSDYKLAGVEYSGVLFGDIDSGKDLAREVSAGTKYVFFSLQTSNGKVRCKLQEAITCGESEKTEINVLNTTIIITAVTERSGTLRAMFDTLDNETPNPQIEIEYEGYPAPSGVLIPLGDTAKGQTLSISLKILNKGEHDLVITGTRPQLSGDNGAQVAAGSYPLNRIPCGEAASVTLDFTPAVTGTNSFTVTVVNNDQINGSYAIPFSSTVKNTWQKLYGREGYRYGLFRAISNGQNGLYAGGFTGNSTAAVFNIDQFGNVKNTFTYASNDGTMGPLGIDSGYNDFFFTIGSSSGYDIYKAGSPDTTPAGTYTTLEFSGQTLYMYPAGILKNNTGYYFIAGNARFASTPAGTNFVYGIFVNRHYSDGPWEKGMCFNLAMSGIRSESFAITGINLLSNGDILLYGRATTTGGTIVAYACAVNVSSESASSWTIRWQNTYGTSDTGFENSFVDGTDIVLVGYNAGKGMLEKFPRSVTAAAAAKPSGWPKTITNSGGTNGGFIAGLPVQDGSGYLLAGELAGGAASLGNLDAWIVKTDKNGTLVWEKKFGGAGDDHATVVVEQPDGFLFGGITSSPSIAGHARKGTEDMYLVKINKDGTMD